MKREPELDLRGSIAAAAFYIISIVALFLNRKCVEALSTTYDYKYSDLASAITGIMFILLGLLIVYLAGRGNRSGATRILELIIIIIPSVMLLFSEFIFATNTYMLHVPLYLQCYRGQLTAVGGGLFGCMLFIEIRELVKKRREKN